MDSIVSQSDDSTSNIIYKADHFDFFKSFSVESCFSHSLSTVSFVHSHLRDLMSDALFPVCQGLIAALSPQADDTMWKAWALFPFMVLCNTRGGKGNSKAEIRANLKKFISGDFHDLYDKACRYEQISSDFKGSDSPTSISNNILKAEILASAGDFSAAFAKLTSTSSLKEINQKEFDKLSGPSMHPSRMKVEFPEIPVTAESISFKDSLDPLTDTDILDVIKVLPVKRAADSLGYRYEHYKALVSTRCCSTLCSVMAHIGNDGLLPDSVAPFFAGASLFGLTKPDDPDGIRPIAVSLCFRRIIGKTHMVNVAMRAADHLQPLQFGVAVKSGTESVAYLIRHFMEADNEFTVWSHDAKNAFNSISRDAIRNALLLYFPDQVPFFDLCYQLVGKLRVYRSDAKSYYWIDSAEGTQQGDPLGPFYFAIAFHPILLLLKNSFPEVLVMAFIDDVNLGGYFKSTIAAAALLDVEGPKIGLHSNMSKCFFWENVNSKNNDSSISSSSVMNSIFQCPDPPPGFEDELKLDYASAVSFVNSLSSDKLLLRHNLSPKRVSDGLKVLGVPCGSDEFINSFMAKKISSIEQALINLSLFKKSQQSALHMIRYVSTSALTYLSRNVIPRLMIPHCKQNDSLVKSACNHLFNYSMEFDQKVWDQFCLPRQVNSPGVGLIPSLLMSPLHFTAANFIFHHQTLISNAYISKFFNHSLTLPHSSSLSEAISSSNNLLLKYPVRLNKRGVAANISHQIATAIHIDQIKVFVDSQVSKMDRARIVSEMQFGANAWMYAIDSNPYLSMQSHLLPIIIHNWVGSIFPLAQAPVCVCAKRASLDPDGYHLKVCPVGKCIETHNNCVDVLADLARAAGHQVSVASAIHHIHPDSNKVPDLNIHSRLILGRDRFIDLRVANPAIKSGPHVAPLAAADKAEDIKERKHGPACRLLRADFEGFAIEFYGALGVKAKSLVEVLCSEIPADTFSPPNWAASSILAYWLQRFSVIIHTSNARRILYLREITLNAHGRHRYKF